jgi:hypothetical protein
MEHYYMVIEDGLSPHIPEDVAAAARRIRAHCGNAIHTAFGRTFWDDLILPLAGVPPACMTDAQDERVTENEEPSSNEEGDMFKASDQSTSECNASMADEVEPSGDFWHGELEVLLEESEGDEPTGGQMVESSHVVPQFTGKRKRERFQECECVDLLASRRPDNGRCVPKRLRGM